MSSYKISFLSMTKGDKDIALTQFAGINDASTYLGEKRLINYRNIQHRFRGRNLQHNYRNIFMGRDKSTKLVEDSSVANGVVIIKKGENVGSQVLITDMKQHFTNLRLRQHPDSTTQSMVRIVIYFLKCVYRVQFSALLKSFLKNHHSHSNKLTCIF